MYMDPEPEFTSQPLEVRLRVRTPLSRLWSKASLFTIGCLGLPICEMGRAGPDYLPGPLRKAALKSLPERRLAGATVKVCALPIKVISVSNRRETQALLNPCYDVSPVLGIGVWWRGAQSQSCGSSIRKLSV